MYRHKLFHFMLILTLLSLTFTSSQGAAAPKMEDETASGIQINEIMFHPAAGGPQWVELKNSGSAPIELSGYSITDEDDNQYTIPEALPPAPPGAFVLVIFDGLGSASDDTDFSDSTATLHTPAGMTGIFDQAGDQCALYAKTAVQTHLFLPLALKNNFGWNPPVPLPPAPFPDSPMVSFAAWGAAPGQDAAEAARAGLWGMGEWINLYRGLGYESEETRAGPSESIGLPPGSAAGEAENWALYQAGEATPGSENPYPSISWTYPLNGALLDSASFALSWMPVPGATGYRFQMDEDAGFSSPLADLALEDGSYHPEAPVPEGVYYWRVKALFASGESPWTLELSVFTIAAPISAKAPLVEKTLDIQWQLQRKDTNMLCLARDFETGDYPWNGPHAYRGLHGGKYCARASMSMLASYYGGKLSQDRITYEIFKSNDPTWQLGHDQGTPREWTDWILANFVDASITREDRMPEFAEIKAWIDNEQPIGASIPGHMRVIDGYREFGDELYPIEEYHVLDPWDSPKWIVYGSENIEAIWVGPPGPMGAANVKSDEDTDGDGLADTKDDSDGDGVVDFDENQRFHTNPSNVDSDGDLVPDGREIREYVYDGFGQYRGWNADIDGDGKRKELDTDNDYADNAGLVDGCEDADWDGIYESSSGESNNFDPTDDMALHLQLTWPLLGSDVDLHLVKPGGEMSSSGDVYFGNRNPDWGMPGVPCDDPRLDIDCISGCTVENIRLSRLEAGNYSVLIHYYSDHSQGPTTPKVTLRLRDSVFEFGPRELSDGEVWNVATIQWPSMTVIPGN